MVAALPGLVRRDGFASDRRVLYIRIQLATKRLFQNTRHLPPCSLHVKIMYCDRLPYSSCLQFCYADCISKSQHTYGWSGMVFWAPNKRKQTCLPLTEELGQ